MASKKKGTETEEATEAANCPWVATKDAVPPSPHPVVVLTTGGRLTLMSLTYDKTWEEYIASPCDCSCGSSVWEECDAPTFWMAIPNDPSRELLEGEDDA